MQENIVNTPNPVEYFFPEPIITKQLRYTMNEAEDDIFSDYCVHLDIIGCNGTRVAIHGRSCLNAHVTYHTVTNMSVPTTTETCPQPTVTAAHCPTPSACLGPVTVTKQHCPSTSSVITPPVVQQATGNSSWMVGVAAGIPLALIVVLVLSAIAVAVVYRAHTTRGR